jgi:YggT family protein
MILIACLLGYFAIQLVSTVTHTTNGVILSLTGGDIVRVIGFLLFGLLAIYSLLIFMRIVFSWGSSSANRLTRFLIRATEPVMGPFRRMIPPLGMFDISPIVVLLLIQLLQQAVFGVFRLY